MSVLSKISYFQNRRDEVPNKELAKTLAETENKTGIAELKTKEICANLDTVKQAIDKGTLITVVWGVKTIAKIASSNKSCKLDAS
jgi:hypothetical protein